MKLPSLRAVVGAVLAVVLEIGLLCGFQTPARAECLNLPQFLADVGANAQKMQFRTETPLTYGFSTDKNPRLSQVADIMAKDREQKRSGGAGKSEFKAGSGAEVLDAVFPQSLSQKGCESVSFGMQAWQVVQSTERSITISRFDKKAYEKTVCRFEVWGTAEQGQLLKTCTQDLNPEHLDFPLKKSKIVMKGSFVFSTGALLSWGEMLPLETSVDDGLKTLIGSLQKPQQLVEYLQSPKCASGSDLIDKNLAGMASFAKMRIELRTMADSVNTQIAAYLDDSSNLFHETAKRYAEIVETEEYKTCLGNQRMRDRKRAKLCSDVESKAAEILKDAASKSASLASEIEKQIGTLDALVAKYPSEKKYIRAVQKELRDKYSTFVDIASMVTEEYAPPTISDFRPDPKSRATTYFDQLTYRYSEPRRKALDDFATDWKNSIRSSRESIQRFLEKCDPAREKSGGLERFAACWPFL